MDNPFFAISDLPYRLPPFDRIADEHYLPAFERGMAEQREEVAAIASDPSPPTFENTIGALEVSGQVLQRVSLVFFSLTATDATEQIQRIEAEVAPRLAAHLDAIYLDRDLFRRIADLYAARDDLALDEESAWLLRRYHTDFVRAGARLSAEEHERLKALNEELAARCAEFNRQLLADTNELAVFVDDAAELDGLPDDEIAAAAEAARQRGADGSYVLTLGLPTVQPALASLTNRALRERLYTASIDRGARGNAYDTSDLVRRIVKLRAERARLLGYPNHAAYVIEDNTAGSVETVREMLAKLTPAAVANAGAEAADLQALIDAENGGFALRPWDWAYYAERLRRQRYEVDDTQLRPYFELERVLHDGVFFAAGKLYGLRFEERADLSGYHPEVRVFEVFDASGAGIGLFLADFYTRSTKRGGAWANALVRQSRLMGTRPVVANNLNISRPPADEPTLLTLDQVRTLFHEFGHALHQLMSDVHFPKFSGTSVPRDFVEYPSQVNEVWMLWPEVLANYAVHHRTGEPLAPEVARRLEAAATFDQGFGTTEYLAATLLDLAWHSLEPEQVDAIGDVRAFEAEALERAGVATPYVLPRYRTTYFSHIFSGNAYSAGYYSYIWSEILDADTVEWLKDGGGLRRENGDHYRVTLLSRGGSADAMSMFRAFRGRDPKVEPLLERRGLTRV